MPAPSLTILSSWQTFYVIIGAAAATLTGLMFIVITLMAGIEVQIPVVNAALAAYNTPTVVHFCTVLLLAGLLSMPWPSLATASAMLVLLAVCLSVYMLYVRHHMRRVPDYQPPLRDLMWYWVVPLSAYVVLLIAAWMLPESPATALYFIGAVMFVILFTGIRNAWDLVTYLAIDRAHPENQTQNEKEG